MSKRENVTESVTFFWVPWWGAYTSVLARTPEDVPPWDSSRGFSLERPLWEVPLRRNGKEVDHVPKEEWDDTLPVLRKDMGDDAWAPSAAPKYGYPRFVRADFVKRPRIPFFRDEDVLMPLKRLLRHEAVKQVMECRREGDPPIIKGRLEKELTALVNRYGFVSDPSGPRGGNCVYEWLLLAMSVAANFEAMDVLATLGFEDMCAHIENKDRLWERTYNHTGPYHPQLPGMGGPWFHLRHEAKGDSASEFVYNISRRYLSFLHLQGASLKTQGNPDARFALQVEGGFREWVHYQLASVWRHRRPIRTCTGCGELFLQSRKDQDCCSSSCRVAKKRKLAQNRSSTSV